MVSFLSLVFTNLGHVSYDLNWNLLPSLTREVANPASRTLLHQPGLSVQYKTLITMSKEQRTEGSKKFVRTFCISLVSKACG